MIKSHLSETDKRQSFVDLEYTGTSENWNSGVVVAMKRAAPLRKPPDLLVVIPGRTDP